MQIVTYQTASLAHKKGYLEWTEKRYTRTGTFQKPENQGWSISAPTQEELKKFIREKRGVHIEIHRNASGYYWSMCRSDGGTDLGWSDTSGPNMGGVWDEYEDAFENALQIQLSYDLPEDKKVIKHWGNYVDYALKRVP